MRNVLLTLVLAMVPFTMIQGSHAVKQIKKIRIDQSKCLKKKKEFNPLDSIEKYKSLLKEKYKKLPVKRRLFVHDLD